jgi:hypothetical protein
MSSSSERAVPAPAARMPADLSRRDPGRTLAGLIDVLDRADGELVRQRPRRPAAHRPAGARSGAVRTVPLRSVQPAPTARPVPGVVRVHQDAPSADSQGRGRLDALTRRVALWGAGPQGEFLAWHSPARHSRAWHSPAWHSPAWRSPAPQVLSGVTRATTPRPQPPAAVHRLSRLRGLVRRVALWGAGPAGEYLAWGGPARTAPKRDADRPVVLREMPSTPTIQPAASSPAAALLPRDPASSAGTWGVPPVPRGAVAVPGTRPSGPPERSQATGWPSSARPSPSATGLVRARGDPLSCPARGSPPSARRSRSPSSLWSSFP